MPFKRSGGPGTGTRQDLVPGVNGANGKFVQPVKHLPSFTGIGYCVVTTEPLGVRNNTVTVEHTS